MLNPLVGHLKLDVLYFHSSLPDNNKIAVHLNKNNIRIPARKDEKKLSKNRKGSMASPTHSLD
jgi:hypothetical protein